ncbi:hypothetical protein ACFL6X_07415 [Candidatus Latescibacterota bacterium]
MVYNQGYALLLYIDAAYGRAKVTQLQEHIGALSFEVAIRRVLGISADQLYDDWVDHLKANYDRQVGEIRRSGHFEGARLEALNGGVIDYHPAYSPDGRRLAYITSEDRDFRIPHLAIYDFETHKQKVLDESVDTRVSWSPDGRQLVYLRNKQGYNDLFIYDVEEDEEHRISAQMRARDPHFSPDGERIAFVRNGDGTSNLAIVNADGTGLAYLTNNNDGTQLYAPRWSPDGEWILFSIFRDDDRDIAMMRSDSPPRPKDWGIRDRTAVPDSLRVFPDSLAFPDADASGFQVVLGSGADERDPCWLPDGSGFVFASDQTGIFNLYLYRSASGEVDQLTNVTGGAFTPTVSADGRVAYASYHANNYDLYEFELGDYRRDTTWEPAATRDYQSTLQAPKLDEEYEIGPYRGRRLLDVVPLLQVGPTYVGSDFGLNQVSGGLQLSTREALGGEELTAWGVLGKNFKERTDLNTDFGVVYRRSLRPVEGNNQGFNPRLFLSWRRREIDWVPDTSSDVVWDTSGVGTLYPELADSVNLLVPDAVQYRAEQTMRTDVFKNVYKNMAIGLEVPTTRRSQLYLQYGRRDYDEDLVLKSFRRHTRTFIVQDGIDISESLPSEALQQDENLEIEGNGLAYYTGLDYYTASDLTFAWQYRRLRPTEDWMVNPNGRALALAYRYTKATLADSLSAQTSPDGVPRDPYAAYETPLTVNEYVGTYTERIGLPMYNSVSLEILGAYRNVKLKPSYDPEGGFFEGRYYWPLRYYVGGLNFLSGYPYFTASGTKLLYGRVAYNFPVLRRMNMRFLNFTFAKLYAELFAETGAVANFDKAGDVGLRMSGEPWRWLESDLDREDFLSDAGGELRLEMFTNYRIPMRVFFQVARPLDRRRELSWRMAEYEDEVAYLRLHDPEQEPPPPPKIIDKWRFYFGLGFFPQDALGAGRQVIEPLLRH